MFKNYLYLNFQAPCVQQDYNVPKIFSLNGGSALNWETINISLPHQALSDTKYVFIAITGNTFSKEKKGGNFYPFIVQKIVKNL